MHLKNFIGFLFHFGIIGEVRRLQFVSKFGRSFSYVTSIGIALAQAIYEFRSRRNQQDQWIKCDICSIG